MPIPALYLGTIPSYLTDASSQASVQALNGACGTGMEHPYTIMPFLTDEGEEVAPETVSGARHLLAIAN
jgi:hypothetical protein